MHPGLVATIAIACACGGGSTRPQPPRRDLADHFPLAALDDATLCNHLLARSAADYAITVDAEPAVRRKVIVSDLHLGPGEGDARFAGIEDFRAHAEWAAFLAEQAALGPTDLIINGDFIEFWQIATARGDLPAARDGLQPGGPVLAADQAASLAELEPVLVAHADVFRELGALIGRGDHRVIIVAGNHDADLLWPRVQLAIARAVDPEDPSRLVFVSGAAYEHAGVHVAHGHAYDAANKFATGHAPFGRDRDGRCRLQSSWGEIFVDKFYTETERQIPFIDNLYPVSAGALWALREHPDPKRDVGAALRFLELIRKAETAELNRDAIGALLQGVIGTPGARDRGPESIAEVIDHLSDRLVAGDATATAVTNAALRLGFDPELAPLWDGVVEAAGALPDVRAALKALRKIDPDALSRLHAVAFGDELETAARRVLAARAGIRVVVFGHTHEVGGSVHVIDAGDLHGHWANTGSWISVASVADLRAKGVAWSELSLADRAMFPSKMTAVTVEYDGTTPRAPVVRSR